MNHTHPIDIKAASVIAAQASPSMAAIWLWIASKPIDYWVAFSGVMFIWAQIAYLMWKWLRDVRRERAGRHVVDDFGDEVRDD